MSTYNDIEVGKVISTLKVIIDRVYVIGDGEEHTLESTAAITSEAAAGRKSSVKELVSAKC